MWSITGRLLHTGLATREEGFELTIQPAQCEILQPLAFPTVFTQGIACQHANSVRTWPPIAVGGFFCDPPSQPRLETTFIALICHDPEFDVSVPTHSDQLVRLIPISDS